MFHRHFSLSFSSYSQISKIFQRRQFYWGKKSRKYKKNNRNSVKKPDIIKQFVGNYCLMENGSFNQFLDFTLRRVFSARWSTLLDRHCYLTHTVFGGLGVSGFGFVWFIYLFLIALAVCLTSAAGQRDHYVTELAFGSLSVFKKTYTAAAQPRSSSFSDTPLSKCHPCRVAEHQPAPQLFPHSCLVSYSVFPWFFSKV